MSFVAKIDRFVRWFFNVSPLTTSIEPLPQPPKRRASSSASRRARSASPKERRDRPAERRDPREPRKDRLPQAGPAREPEEA